MIKIDLDRIIEEKGEKCWDELGVFGSGICELLNEYNHCKICPVYISSGRKLLHRDIPDELIDEWTELFTLEKSKEQINKTSVVVFKISGEWLAIKTELFQEAVVYKYVHSVPGRTNKYFHGVLNVNGELLLCISMAAFLELPEAMSVIDEGKVIYKSILVLNEKAQRYAFPIDEFAGVFNVPSEIIESIPATVSKSDNTISTGLFVYNDKKVGLIDDKKLIEILKRRLVW